MFAVKIEGGKSAEAPGQKLFEPFNFSRKTPSPPRDGKGHIDFYHNWTKSILQQLKRQFLKIAYALFRISSMSNSRGLY